MYTRSLALLTGLGVVLLTSTGRAEGPDLGTPISERELAAWDITVFPSGANLPPGSGTAAQGAPIYAAKCALCHGVDAEGGTAAGLVGGEPVANGIDVRKTIANFWASATTFFDFTRRQMPWQQPRTLTDDEVYALTAYILVLNGIIEQDAVMNAETLPNVRMPNRDGFMPRFPELMP
jgi:cytochrome c